MSFPPSEIFFINAKNSNPLNFVHLLVLPCFDVAAIAGPLGLLDSAPRPDIHCLLATSSAAVHSPTWNNGIDTTEYPLCTLEKKT